MKMAIGILIPPYLFIPLMRLDTLSGHVALPTAFLSARTVGILLQKGRLAKHVRVALMNDPEKKCPWLCVECGCDYLGDICCPECHLESGSPMNPSDEDGETEGNYD